MGKFSNDIPCSRNYLKCALSFFYPLTSIVLFYMVGLGIFFFFRVALCQQYFSRVKEVENYIRIFPIGFRIDTILLCYLLAPPFLALCLLPQKIITKFRWMLSSYFTAFSALFIFLEVATFPFMAEFDSRLNRLFLEHMVQIREVFGMILKGHTESLIFGLSASMLTGWILFRCFQKLNARSYGCSVKKRLTLFFAGGLFLIFGVRSSFIHHAANINLASFSTSQIVNQLALNSSYSLAYAYYSMKKMEKDPTTMYGKMAPSEMFRLVRKSAGIADEACTNSGIPLLHYQQSGFPAQPPLNLVIILEESLGSEYVGCLGGLPLTPNIDRLSTEGFLFTHLYATGIRTVRGIEAILSGFLPTPGESTVKLGLCQKNFFTIAELLRRRGYITEFIYGGRRSFDSMSTFFFGNGFDEIYDKYNFKNPVFSGTWGVSDEDLFGKANEIFKNRRGNPFFALILTASNHDPFEFPDGWIEPYEQPKETRHNAIKYADYALGKFFETAKKEKYYNNTIFLIIADHSTRLQGEDLIPIHKFDIPALIIGPHVKPGTYAKVASQIDMTPTLLDLMVISTEHPVAGRALLSLPDTIPGRAVMQYGDTNAFMEEDRVVLLRKHMKPVQFTCNKGRLLTSKTDKDLVTMARAHALLPGYLYFNQLHHLPAIQD